MRDLSMGPSRERIVRARKESGLTQEEVARLAGFSVVTVGKWERGTRIPSGPYLRRYAAVTGKPVNWFFAEDEEMVA